MTPIFFAGHNFSHLMLKLFSLMN